MFISRAVMLGVIGIPPAAGGGGAPTYNWIFMAGPGNNTAQYTLDTYTETSRGTISNNGTGNPASFGNESYGWFCGGYQGTSATAVSRFNNASIATNSTAMTSMNSNAQQNGIGGACYKTGQSGYTFGGTGGGTWTNIVLKYNISGDSWSTMSATLAATAGWPATHNNGTYALVAGGYNGSNRGETNVYTFSSDSVSAGSTLGSPTRDWQATGDQTNFYGYCGSNDVGGVGVNTIRKIGIATGTQATTFTNSASLRYGEGAGSDTNGLFTGGDGQTSLVREVVYATDTFSSKTSLSTGRTEHGAYSGAQTA
jgi:hypothetical protein